MQPVARVDWSRIPAPASRNIALRVSAQAERALRAGHPWLFESAIQEHSHDGQPGDLAVAFDHKGRFLAVGLFDPHSPIRVHVLQHGQPATINVAWFRERLQVAARLRAPLLEGGTNGYRLVYGENDGLPGLVVDRYDRTLVLKLYTVAWVPHLQDVLAALQDVMPAERCVLRLSRAVRGLPGSLYGLEDGLILTGADLPGPVLFRENGLCFEADPIHGQKTGFFLDQRENRARVEERAAGNRVLNVFAYSGGFSVYAARGGAREVVSLDLSRPALEAAERNWGLNQDQPGVAACHHELLAADAFHALAELARSARRFDLLIVDPPSFAKQQSEVPRALAAYARLTRLSLGVLRPGGMLVMASCSSRVSADAFFATVHRAALQTGRPLREIVRTGHALDHPVRFKEGAYLKCLFAVAR
jgi:23S rRNA (cytosine1962-C5)-methyltransferase